MGIRYYAYAYDPDCAPEAVADPLSFVSSDPLADAWGFEPHASEFLTTFEQSVSKRDLLYLDKVWRDFQAVTGPSRAHPIARPSFRMFEGDVTLHGWEWTGWVRAIVPDEVPAIRDDLVLIDEAAVRERFHPQVDADVECVLDYLGRAQEFVRGIAGEGRGFVYVIQ